MPDPTVREMLLAKVDELVATATDVLAELREVTEQLEPERARSRWNAHTMASVMVDEIRLRAQARPLDEAPGNIANYPSVVWCRPLASGWGAASRPDRPLVAF